MYEKFFGKKSKYLKGYHRSMLANYSRSFTTGHGSTWNFYPRYTRVNIGLPIIPPRRKFNFAAHSALKFGFETVVSHINFGFDPRCYGRRDVSTSTVPRWSNIDITLMPAASVPSSGRNRTATGKRRGRVDTCCYSTSRRFSVTSQTPTIAIGHRSRLAWILKFPNRRVSEREIKIPYRKIGHHSRPAWILKFSNEKSKFRIVI